MALLAESGFLNEIFGEFSYLAPFVVLLLCGLGLPLPEEVSLIGSGLLLHRGEVRFVPITLVCAAAILIGDSIPFWLGRRYGMSALKIRWVARILHPERFARLRIRFEEHGVWATFACRFLAGFRTPGYFIAGTMGMRYPRFLLIDLAGVVLSVPVSIYLGKIFGGSVDRLTETVHDIHLILAFLTLSLVLILVLSRRRRPREIRPAVQLRVPDPENVEAPRPEPQGAEAGPREG
ncbi:MAG: DedA family protein [Planctomycetota bacterium]